jgi:hypothetical protein
MKFIIFLFLTFFLKTVSIKTAKPKLCINCKHFIPDDDSGEFSRCSFFPHVHRKINYLVNGINKIDKGDFYYCSTARSSDNMCGIEGKSYVKKRIIIKNKKNI